MNRQQALEQMKPPGARKKGKWMEGVIQIWITRMCDKTCFGCTQGSNLKSGPREDMFITLENFEIAVKSLVGYHGVVGIFGGNPALHPEFAEICAILSKHIPHKHRGLWCNNPFGHASLMRHIFNPNVSNLNVHLDRKAYDEFKRGWPECRPVGLKTDSRHSPVHGSMLDLDTLPDPNNPSESVPNTEDVRWHWISKCDINQHWSGMVGQFRGQPRAWFCEVAGAQAMLQQRIPCTECNGEGEIKVLLDQPHPDPFHKDNWDGCRSCKGSGYQHPDTGIPLPQEIPWWQGDMNKYADQVDQHCHNCLVPLRGYGELACSTTGKEVTTKTYLPVFQPKKLTRGVVCAESNEQLQTGKIKLSTDYIGNSNK